MSDLIGRKSKQDLLIEQYIAQCPVELPCTDAGNAKRLLKNFGDRIRYVTDSGKWICWNQSHWQWDKPDHLGVLRLCADTIRKILIEASNEPDRKRSEELAAWAVQAGRASRLLGMLTFAKIERGLDIDLTDLDVDPWLLGTPNGVIDLRDASFHRACAANKDFFITKVVAVDYNPAAQCPTWLRFLSQIFAGDEAMVAYIQRVCGYLLTGLTLEQVMFILVGSGSNGKSIFTETISALLGPYAETVPYEAFMEKRGGVGGPTPELAALRGARAAFASESEEGNVLASGIVKRITGGDRIPCRELYGRPFSYLPNFKVFLTTNHKPTIKDDGYGMWRRIHLIEFPVRFEGEARDNGLRDRLWADREGILAWMVDGAVEYRKHGLGAAKAVLDATATYRASQDLFQQWFEECCIEQPGVEEFSALYASFEVWCRAELGEVRLSKKAFGGRLDDRRFGRGRGTKGQLMRQGLKLKPMPGDVE